nr:hypothetical protein [Tanacetum cinerariifolium]
MWSTVTVSMWILARFIENFSKIAKPLTLLTQKNKTYAWGDKQDEAFCILKEKLCNAPVLALPDGPNDFVVYCDASKQGFRHYMYGMKSVIYTDHKSLQFIFDPKELNMRQKRWIKLLSDYECEIKYHPGKENVVADALSRKERLKPRRVRAMSIIGGVRKLIMDEAHTSRYSVHSGADKMYYDLRDLYWWPAVGGYDDIWVILDRLTKSAHFLSIREDYKIEKLARIYMNETVARHGVPVSIISNRDGRFALHLWQALQEALGTRLDISMAYHPQTDGQSEHTIQTLEYMLRAFVMDFGGNWILTSHWLSFLITIVTTRALKIVQETTKKIIQIKKRLKMARSRQKSYADKRRKPLEFKVGDRVLLKVSPWKGVIEIDENLRFVEDPIEIVERDVKK